MTGEKDASAERPGEIERAFNLAARAMQRRFSASGSEEDIEAALSEFFAPILAEKEREIERLKLDRDAAQLNEAEAIDLMNEYKALLEAAEAAAIRAQGE